MSLVKMRTALNGQSLFVHFTDVPWITEIANEPLDLVYSTRSDDKWVAPLVSRFLDDSKTHLSSDDLDIIAISIQTIFGINWNKLWEAVNEEYKITDNYNMETIRKETGTVVDDGNVTNTGTTTTDIQSASSDSVFGFNSEDSVKSDEGESGTTNTVTEGTSQDRDNTKTTDMTETTTRHGNIGVMIYPSMLKSEIDVRKWNFFEKVFSDIDSLLTLSVY